MATVTQFLGRVAAIVDPADHWASSAPGITIINKAITRVEKKLRARNVLSLLTEQVLLTVAPGVNKLTSSSTPPLPSNFEAPFQVFERPNDAGADVDWAECRTQIGPLPTAAVPPESIGGVYQWRNGELRFGTVVSDDVDLSIIYWVKAAPVTVPSSTMPYPRIEDILVDMVAAGFARTRGMRDFATDLEAAAFAAIDDLSMQENLSAKTKPAEFRSS